MTPSLGRVETCERCGAELGVGRYCLNCGHPVGAPVEDRESFLPWLGEDEYDDHGWAASVTDDSVADDAPVVDPDDDLEGPAENPGEPRAGWLPWLVGTVGLVVLLLVLVSCLGNDEGSGAAQDATTGESSPEQTVDPEETEEPETTKKQKPGDVSRTATVTAPVTAPPTTDLDGQTVAYEAAQMLDRTPATAWRMPGDGTGTVLTFTLAEPTEITRVGLVNGYAKQIEGVDWYPNNRRITSATWTFAEGTTVDQSFEMRPRLQTLKVDPVTTSTVTLTITGVTPPGPGTLGRDYTAISEVRLIGRPAG